MKKSLLYAGFLALVLVGLSVPASAQITGTIAGTVKDQTNAVIPGATVTASSPNLHRAEPSVVTGQGGRFTIVGLPAGAYKLTVELSGFATTTLDDIRLGINETLDVNVVLRPAGVEATVRVSAEAPLVEVKSSALGQSITPEVIENMPLNGRQFLDLISLVPGTAPRPQSSDQGSGVTAFGERSVTNSFLVDGMENNDDYSRDFAEFYIQDVIQEFKVELGGYQAEYGRASGAVANVITRSGTNQFRGRGFLFGRSDALDASNVPGQKPPALERMEGGGFAGGPIVRNKAWYFAGVQRLKETRGANYNLSTIPQSIKDGWYTPTVGNENFDSKPVRENTTIFGKINQQFAASNQIFGSININRGTNDGAIPSASRAVGSPPPGSIALLSTASDITNNTYSASVRDTAFLSNAAFLESSFRYVRLHYQENTDKTLGAEQLFPGTFNAQGQVTFWLSNSSAVGILDRANDRYQWMETLNVLKDTEKSGHHAFKFGFDLNRVKLNNNFQIPITAIVANTMFENSYKTLDISTVEMHRQSNSTEGNRTQTLVHNTILSGFAQDAWEPRPGLTVNAGLRYDYASLFNEANRNFAPRIGIAWDPRGDGKTVLRANYGIYFDQNILELATNLPELGGLQITSWQNQLIPRGASTFYNPSIGAYAPLMAGTGRFLANPKFFTYIMPAGMTFTSSGRSITGLGQPFIIYDLLGIPVTDPRNPPILAYDNISKLTGGRLTPEQAAGIINAFFPGTSCEMFVWDAPPRPGSIVQQRDLVYKFRQCGSGYSRINTLQHPEKTPYTGSFNAGIQRQLGADLSVDGQLFIRRSRDLLAARVINLREVPVGTGCLQNTVDNGPCNKQMGYIGLLNADVLTVALQKRLSHRYQFLASYTYTHAIDNFSTLRVPPLSGETSFLFSNDPELDLGRSLNTPNQVFVFSGLWKAPYGIDVSGILKSASGSPFNTAGGGQDSDGDEIFDNRLIGTKKGGFLTDPLFSVDMRLAKEFRLGGRVVQGLVDIFNVTNRANPLRVDNALGPNIGRTIEPLPGREMQLGLRIDF